MTSSMRKNGKRINGTGTNNSNGAPFLSSSMSGQHPLRHDQQRKKRLGMTTRKRQKMTVCSFAMITILVLIAIEVLAYTAFTLPPEHHHQQQQQQEQQQQYRESYRNSKELLRSKTLMERRQKQQLIQSQSLTSASVSVSNHVDHRLLYARY